MNEEITNRPSVVVLGGGYGGITAAKALDDVADVTLVDPKDAFVHNVAAWRALVEPEWLERIFFPYERLLSDGRFLRDRAVAVNGRDVTLASGTQLRPDYLVLATGSAYPFPAKSDERDTETARARFRDAHEALLGAERVLVIGAGPSGLELAGEIKAFFPDKHVTIADMADDILEGPYDPALRVELRRQLAALGVELRLGSPLLALPDAAPATAAAIRVTTAAGDELLADIWYRCFGVRTQTEYLRGSLADARDAAGYVRVDEQLQVIGSERVFAIGDIADADRNMAGMAGAQAKLVAENIRALIAGAGEPAAYTPFPPVIAIPLGPEGGAGQLPGIEGIAGPEVIAERKGRAMMVDRYDSVFNAGSPSAAA
jgi:NADH dehydrogenase FAD-containing subunit